MLTAAERQPRPAPAITRTMSTATVDAVTELDGLLIGRGLGMAAVGRLSVLLMLAVRYLLAVSYLLRKLSLVYRLGRLRARVCAARGFREARRKMWDEEKRAMVASNRPPMTARPRGAFCSPPSPRPSAIGTMPMIMASAVIITGRKRTKPAFSAAFAHRRRASKLLAGKADNQNRVRRGHAHAHDRSRQGRHAQTRSVRNRTRQSRPGRRQSGDDEERVKPGLEVDDDQEVDQQNR